MSTDYFQYGALASPARTPEHTPPELAASKPSSRGRTKHRDFSTKSAPLPSFDASDISEILTLRRELDSKHQFIDTLEENLKNTNTENETLSGQLRESTKKTRQLEQKFKLLENGTFDAVEGLLAERDNVKIANQELRNKLDAATKKTKTLEEENIRAREAWDQERRSWQTDKRQLEQKVHISETRLRAVVEEVRTHHLASQAQQKLEDTSGDNSDAASVHSYRHARHARNQSSMSVRSLAPSISSVRRPAMTSLANELNSDDEDYDTEDLKGDDEDLPLFAQNRSIEAPISPPDTPHYVTNGDVQKETPAKPVYQSVSTQTELAVPGDLASRRNVAMAAVEVLPIPAITIQPPLSPRAGESVLPPGMRSSFVQTEEVPPAPMLDAAVQTEEIRIDRRPIKLPPYLLPSALEQGVPTAGHESQTATKRRVVMHRSTFSKDGNRLPLKPIDLPPPRLRSVNNGKHQHQQSEDNSSEPTPPQWYVDTDANDQLAESSDDMRAIFGNMPGIVRPSVRSLFNGPPKTVPENRAVSPGNFVISPERPSVFAHGKRMGSDGSSNQSRPPSSRGTAHSVRTGPFFSSHERKSSRPNTASSYGATPAPPFPIPGRISSRPPTSEGPQSPTVRGSQSMRSRRLSKESRVGPDGGLRKVQSSGAMRTNARMSPRRRRRAPDLEPIKSMAFDTPSKDNLLLPDIVTPTHESFGNPHRNQNIIDSPDFDQDSAVEEEDEQSQDNVIVDAIAATMVGEWMWKYVRRRRSFTIGESRADQIDEGAGSGVRHKRWVWLSPYEQTVMWSSKQPNSGPALLGKAGRKLLDVKDTTPLHKSASHEPIFDRSILILTPERALKLTACNKERHYLWLTALSFLAQSGRGPPQVPRLSPEPEPTSGNTHRRRSSLLPGPILPTKTAIGPALAQNHVKGHQRLDTADSTAPPDISRINGGRHQRKRSSTNPLFARRSSNTATYQTSASGPTRPNLRPGDRDGSDRSIGTVRMDAFIGQGRGDNNTRDMMTGKGYIFGESLEVDPFEEF
ncbi:unnamed protein product [Aureobasidium mustum]|uniref:Pleckstrin homology domain-containing protein n=1 Tax=Aureobasidium mustum TaxID=2773714 RepID=A0A9N8PGP8_9PEZI|nr:unnamed protein product [Aureobasidium mustum]